ncbi:MAG: hypothetical protein QG594_1017, partial [Bacteroidota bacterium]|nr:hypothetical protein [Bacteroidota bacterium]
MVTAPVNLNDFIVPQAIEANQRVDLSAPMLHQSPFKDTI